MSYVRTRQLGAESDLYPWKQPSADTLKMQAETNDMLKVAGYCPIPSSGLLEGSLCGARNFLNLHAKQLFGKDVSFPNPDNCTDHEEEWQNPIFGCFKPSSLPLSKNEWILIGGAASAVIAVYLLSKTVKPKRAVAA